MNKNTIDYEDFETNNMDNRKEELNMANEKNEINFDMQSLMNVVGQASMTVQSLGMDVQSLTRQFGVVATKVDNISEDVNCLKDEVEYLKQNEEITTTQVKTLTTAVKSRVRAILGEDDFEYVKYAKGFFKRLYADVKREGGMGSSVDRTLKCNFQNALDYIEAWSPKGGVSALKKELDTKAEANRKAKELGYS